MALLERRAKALRTLEMLQGRWTRVAQEASDLDLSPDKDARVAAAALKHEATSIEDQMRVAQGEARAAADGLEDRVRKLGSRTGGGPERDEAGSSLPLKR
jgi:hypothetical protein